MIRKNIEMRFMKTLARIFISDYDGEAKNGRWFFYGVGRVCGLLDKYKYEIVSEDAMLDKDPLSPTVHFRKRRA